MSKYIKLEDALKAVRDNTMPLDCWHIDRMRAIADLPTIEVSEDCISREWVQNRLTKYVKDYELNELDSWQNTIVEWIATDIEDAPSVVPRLDKEDLPSVVPKDHGGESTEMVGEWIADTPQTDYNANQCVQRIEYVGDIEKKRCRTCKHFKSEFHTPISSDGTYYTYVICTEKECIYKEKG